jgi:adenosine deaminase
MNDSWYDRVPKTELHVHLEGAIPLDALWELVLKYGGTREVPDASALTARFSYRDFPHFIETWMWKNQFLREYEDFTFFSEAVARDLVSQNVRYAEITFSPSDFARHGLKTRELAESIRAGLTKVPEIEISLIADLVRNNGPENAARTLTEITEVKDLGIIGITIGGSEHDYPPGPLPAVYRRRGCRVHNQRSCRRRAGRKLWARYGTCAWKG